MKNNNIEIKKYMKFCAKNDLSFRDINTINLYCDNCNFDNNNKENFKLILNNYLKIKKSLELHSNNFKMNKTLNKILFNYLSKFYAKNGLRIEEINKDLAYEFLYEFKKEFNLNDQELREVEIHLNYCLGGILFG